MLIAVGTADKDVDPSNSTQFADALRAKGDTVELKRYPGLGCHTDRVRRAVCRAHRVLAVSMHVRHKYSPNLIGALLCFVLLEAIPALI